MGQGRMALTEPEEDLPTLLQTLVKFRKQSRQPTPTAYHAILRCACDYVIRRGKGVGRPGISDEDLDGIGWHLTIAALQDADEGGVDIGEEGFAQLLRVSHLFKARIR